MRCVCCALPARLLEHISAQAGDAKAARRDRETSEQIRSQRHTRALQPQPTPQGGHRRLVYDVGGGHDLPGRLVRAEGAAAVHDADVNEAYDNIGLTLRFFSQVFGRDSLDGRGMDVNASVHFGERYANAMWNGEQMLFGDGDGIHVGGFTRSLGIVAHELTHAVTQHSIPGGLGVVMRGGKPDLAGEAGALNESVSDVFASLVRQWHAKQDARTADWLVGQDILAPAVGHAVRSLKDPGNPAQTYAGDPQVAHMKDYEHGGDAHANSGIPNHAFYLCAQELGGHAWEHAGRIWYEAVPLLDAKATFAAAAKATLAAASRLFGHESKEQQAVEAAWKKVGVRAG